MTHKGQPFLFDANVFDPDDPRYSRIDKTKPKLEYTQEHLAQAKESSFEAGKIAGFKESQASLLQDIQKVVQKIDRDTASLFAKEEERNTLFEAEAVHLTLRIFEKVFAAYTEKIGSTEVERVVAEALRTHKDVNMIALEVHPNLQGSLQDFIKQLESETHKCLIVKANPALGKQECKILWSNGGITYDVQKIKDRIYKTLSESLSVYNINVQDQQANLRAASESGEN